MRMLMHALVGLSSLPALTRVPPGAPAVQATTCACQLPLPFSKHSAYSPLLIHGSTRCTLRAFRSQIQATPPFVLRLSHSAGQAHAVVRSRRDRSVSGCFILIAAGLSHQRRPHATAGGRSSSDSRMQVARVPLQTLPLYMTLLFILFLFSFFLHACARPLSKNKNFFVKEVVKRVEKS